MQRTNAHIQIIEAESSSDQVFSHGLIRIALGRRHHDLRPTTGRVGVRPAH